MISDNIVGTQELEARIAELEASITEEPSEEAGWEVWDDWEELKALHAVRDQLSYCWKDNATLIKDSYFEEYCEDFCYDTDSIEKNSFLTSFINWGKVADAMRQDYRSVTLGSNEYWVRS